MQLVFVVVISALCAATPVPSGPTTARSPAQIGDTIKVLTNQLMEANATSSDLVTLDTRTPPKIKQQTKKKTKLPEAFESSHAGVAIPVDEHDVVLEETTKKLSFYKIEKPTTNSGLSTWILLSGQTTAKPSRKPVVKPNDVHNTTIVVDPPKIVKPVFKKRTTTTPASTTKKGTTASTTTTTEATTTIASTTPSNSSALPVEAKDGEAELTGTTDKKTKRPSTNKRKKNKNRRRRPAEESTKLDKPLKAAKEKPIGTQLYNYLSREVMPTVGVGLVGLMVTAGLAGYFLYPFGVARRSYDIDRRDKDHYYYSDEYSGGIAEEEAIGKVIAGMPSNSLYGNSYKTPTSRHSFNNNRRVIEQSTGYTVAGEEATPAAVPEHGPRSLRLRRQLPPDDGENEIDGVMTTTERDKETTTTTQKTESPDKVKSFVEVLRELFHLKMHLGLQLLQNATQAVSKYVSHVQRRLDDHYRNSAEH